MSVYFCYRLCRVDSKFKGCLMVCHQALGSNCSANGAVIVLIFVNWSGLLLLVLFLFFPARLACFDLLTFAAPTSRITTPR
jgi:hypothetical protein